MIVVYSLEDRRRGQVGQPTLAHLCLRVAGNPHEENQQTLCIYFIDHIHNDRHQKLSSPVSLILKQNS